MQTSEQSYHYYPGCFATSLMREYDEATRVVMKKLGVGLVEIPGWTCCGEFSSDAPPPAFRERDLSGADGARDIVTPCSVCFGRLRETAAAGRETAGPGREILHVVDVLARDDVLDAVRERVQAEHDALSVECAPSLIERIADRVHARLRRRDEPPAEEPTEDAGARVPLGLERMRFAAHYGCLAHRLRADGTRWRERGKGSLERIIDAIGAASVPWRCAVSCAGAALATTERDAAMEMTERVLLDAIVAGADAIVTSCPHCGAQMDLWQEEISLRLGRKVEIPVLFVAEAVGVGMWLPEAEKWVARHLTSFMEAFFQWQRGWNSAQ